MDQTTLPANPSITSEHDATLTRLRREASQDLGATFQARVQPWLMACFGPVVAGDREERNHRFLEEAVELVQACGCTKAAAHALVDYVYGRPVGEKAQEVGGVMVTLAALCLAQNVDINVAAEAELARIWTEVEAIRAKHARKPKHSPLAGAADPRANDDQLIVRDPVPNERAWGAFRAVRCAPMTPAMVPASKWSSSWTVT